MPVSKARFFVDVDVNVFHGVILCHAKNVKSANKVSYGRRGKYFNSSHCKILYAPGANDIGKNARCGYFSPGTCSFHNKRLCWVTFGIEKDDIIFSIQVKEIMLRI